MEMTRRSFVFRASALGGSLPNVARAHAGGWRDTQPTTKTLNAGDVVQRIKANVGIPWAQETVDAIVAGTPETPVKGIATTMMATLDVLQRAAGAGRNMVITHEPTFYSHQERVDDIRADATYQFKTDFIKRHEMAVFHFHEPLASAEARRHCGRDGP